MYVDTHEDESIVVPFLTVQFNHESEIVSPIPNLPRILRQVEPSTLSI